MRYVSLLSPGRLGGLGEGDPALMAVADRALAAELPGAWRKSLDAEIWCHLRPASAAHRDQGWKLHLSATTDSAVELLRRALAVLLPAGCPLKFAAGLDRLELLNSAHYPRGGAGKFITAYPVSEAQFRWLAARLHERCGSLAGPRILSDRPYRPGSVVHYRYGGFVRRQRLSNDAERTLAIAGPAGELVEDRRDAWFAPPAWAPAAFPGEPDGVEPAPARAEPVLLGGRFVAREAIRHSNRGGVYRATDRSTGDEVIVKQARYGVLGTAGVDAQRLLRTEAAALSALAPLGAAPAGLDLFEQGGDLFLAQELVAGEPLRLWVRRHGHAIGPRTPRSPGVAWDLLAATLERLVGLVRTVHAAGWVIRDLSPNNVIVAGSGAVRLVDLESAARIGQAAPAAATPGYAPPEPFAGGAAVTADLYALGAIAFMMAAGIDPQLAVDGEPRSWPARMRDWLGRVDGGGSAQRVVPLVEGLTAAEPGQRWSLDRVASWLASPGRRSAGRRPAAGRGGQRLVEDGLDHLRATATPGSSERFWPGSCSVGSVDTCNVQHGSAGTIAVLARALRHGVTTASAELLGSAVAWTERQLAAEPVVLPGLYFGRSGIAWALSEAAGVLDDAGLADRAVAIARQVPVGWPNPDVAHGTAGAGLTQLWFWRETRLPEFRDRAVRCAEALSAHAVRTGGELVWPVPADFPSRLAGIVHYGFAHGVAGIGHFLLAAGQETGRADLVALADEAGQTLAAAAVHHDRAALWATNTGSTVDPSEHWCSGSSGVGTFLLRLWQVTGTARYRELAEAAGLAVWRRRWYATPVACHGLAGNGQYLLDLAAATGDERYHRWAERLADLIDGQHVVHDRRRLVPDETRSGLGTEYGIGSSGVLDFLLRLHHGGPRPWTPEQVGVLAPA